MALSNRKLTAEDVERCGVSGGGDKKFIIEEKFIQHVNDLNENLREERKYSLRFAFDDVVNASNQCWVPAFYLTNSYERVKPDGSVMESYPASGAIAIYASGVELADYNDGINIGEQIIISDILAAEVHGVLEIRITRVNGEVTVEVTNND